MSHREGTEEPGGADEIAAARDALGGRHDPLDGGRGGMDRTGEAQEAVADIVEKRGDDNLS